MKGKEDLPLRSVTASTQSHQDASLKKDIHMD